MKTKIVVIVILIVITLGISGAAGGVDLSQKAPDAQLNPSILTYESEWISAPPGVHITMYPGLGALPSVITEWCMINTDNGNGVDAVPCEYVNDGCMSIEHADAELVHLRNDCPGQMTIRVNAVLFVYTAYLLPSPSMGSVK